MDKIDCIYILNLKKERSRLKQCLMLLADEEIYIPIKVFPGIYWDTETAGIYNCKCCDVALFDSGTKFDAGCGWPSFFEPIDEDVVRTREDLSLGMQRLEVLCNRCDAHLGHVFPDGPQPTGLRYCINSVSLDLEPKNLEED